MDDFQSDELVILCKKKKDEMRTVAERMLNVKGRESMFVLR